MVCRIKYIDELFGENTPKANELTEKYHSLFKELSDSGLFQNKNSSLLLAPENTKKSEKQLQLINSINTRYSNPVIGRSPDNKVAIDVRNIDSKVFLSTSNYASQVLSPEQLSVFKKLQKTQIISKKSFTLSSTSKVYTIPKIREEVYTSHTFDRSNSIYKKDYNKKTFLDNLIQQNGWNWIRTRETQDSIMVELGDFSGSQYKLFESMDSVESTPASSITMEKVLNFLKNIGFTNIQKVKELFHNGESIEGNAYVDMIQGVMQIVEGKERISLPEEAMHILTELIQNSDSALFRTMEKDIVNYQLYHQLVNDPAYTSNPFYRTANGIDYAKLKKEAIAKLLAEYLVGNDEKSIENDRKLLLVNSWWRDIVDWIRRIFGKYQNPFKQALEKLEKEGDTSFGVFSDLVVDENGVYLSATRKTVASRDEEYSFTRAIFENIKNAAAEKGITKAGSDYYKNGKKLNYSKDDLIGKGLVELNAIASEIGQSSSTSEKEAIKKIRAAQEKRVSDLKDEYYESMFRNKPLDEGMKETFLKMAEDGTYIHSLLEDSIESLIDPKTGLVKVSPGELNPSLATTREQINIQNYIHTFVKGFIAGFPEGTRFLTENIIYDEENKIVGTVDLMAITPTKTEDTVTGYKVDIYDWKSMLYKTPESIKDYKKEGYDIQLSEYRRILKDAYDVENFGKIRAIPIQRITNPEKQMVAIEIGDFDASKIKELNLRPVISTQESTGDPEKDALLDKLEGIYKLFVNELKKGKREDSQILREIQNTIYELRTSDSVNNLRVYLIDLRERVKKVLLDAENPNNLTDKGALESILLDISLYQDIFENLSDVRFLTDNASIDKDTRQRLENLVGAMERDIRKLKTKREELLDEFAKKNGVFGLLSPEKIVGNIAKVFRSMGNQSVASIKLLYELVNKAKAHAEIKADEDLKEISKVRKIFMDYASKAGIPIKDAIGKLVNYNKGILHSKIDPEFFKKRDELIESKNKQKIKDFIRENYNVNEYAIWYQEERKRNIDFWATMDYSSDEAENKKIRKNKLDQFERIYNIEKYPLSAYTPSNKQIWNRNIKEEKWLSKEFQEIQSIPELKQAYDFFTKKNKELLDLGLIEDWRSHNFLPNVRKTIGDILSLEDKNWLEKITSIPLDGLRNWKKSLQVEDYELNYSEKRDPLTGEKTGERYVKYLNYLPANEKSFDIFTIYGLMSEEIAKEKYLQGIDQISRSLVHVEQSKINLDTNKFGKITMSGGKPLMNKKLVGQNAPLLMKFADHITKGQEIQIDTDAAVSFAFREKWNNSPAGKIYKFDINPDTYKPTAISATKFLMWLNNLHQKRVLGLNASSALSNLFGGQFSAGKIYSKFVSPNDIHTAYLKMTSGRFYGSEESKKLAGLVDYFLPFLDNREKEKSGKLSVNKAATILSQDWLMYPMRKTEEIVQLNIFLAHIENTGLIDGKLVNLREEASKRTNYKNRYNVSPEERSKMEKEFEKTLEDLKDKYKLSKTAILKEENGEKFLEIPGYDRFSDDVQKIRDISRTMAKDALGSVSEYDVAPYKYNIFWRVAMTFKNWIPRMVDVRFAEFKHSQAHNSYDYGRVRMLFRGYSSNLLASIVKIIPIPLSGKMFKNLGKEDMIKRAKEIWKEKEREAKKLGQYNKETFISQDEFVDMFIQGTDAMFAEFRTISLITLALMSALMTPDDDDDGEQKAWKALIRRQVDKMQDEVGFFYSPRSAVSVIGQGPPIGGLIKDMFNLTDNVGRQMFGFGLDQAGFESGEEMMEKAKPAKYTFKVLPVMKEILTYIPVADEDVAKDWGVRIQNRNGF